jgi:hypothetical protein
MANYRGQDREEFHKTTKSLMEYMSEILEKNFDTDTIIEFLENSAGDGELMDYIASKYKKPVIGFDIVNRTGRPDIEIIDYGKKKLEYKKGRVAFINPPFAKGIKFCYKSLEECDYVVSILSVNSFVNIDYDKYEVDDIYILPNYDFGTCKASICIIGMRKK